MPRSAKFWVIADQIMPAIHSTPTTPTMIPTTKVTTRSRHSWGLAYCQISPIVIRVPSTERLTATMRSPISSVVVIPNTTAPATVDTIVPAIDPTEASPLRLVSAVSQSPLQNDETPQTSAASITPAAATTTALSPNIARGL